MGASSCGHLSQACCIVKIVADTVQAHWYYVGETYRHPTDATLPLQVEFASQCGACENMCHPQCVYMCAFWLLGGLLLQRPAESCMAVLLASHCFLALQRLIVGTVASLLLPLPSA